MPVPPEFQFSQNNLQDYIDCPRRFQLRHLLRQKWPALQSEPVLEQEQRIRLGERFHQLIYQHQAGIFPEDLSAYALDPLLSQWWSNYLHFDLSNLPSRRYPEFALSAPFATYRLVAKYDLLAVQPGQKFVILDWKTSRKRPSRSMLQERIQTRLYPLLLVLAGFRLNDGAPVSPDQIEMIYWFAEEPERPEVFTYTHEQYEADHQEIYRLVTQIASNVDKVFFLTTMEKHCIYCTYRSLCGRGERAGDWSVWEEEAEAGLDTSSLDFNQVEEIKF